MSRESRRAAREATAAQAECCLDPIAGECPDEYACALSQLDRELFRDDAAHATAVAELNEARKAQPVRE